MMVDEEATTRRLRAKWLLAEKAILAEHRAQLQAHSGLAGAALVKKPMNRGTDAIGAAGVRPLGFEDDCTKDDFQRVNARRGVLQSLNLFVVHALALLRLRKPKQPADSIQSQVEKEAA